MRFGLKKICDKCHKKGYTNTEILRVAFQIQFPNYEYSGVDLCRDCLDKLDNHIEEFFKEEKDGVGFAEQ